MKVGHLGFELVKSVLSDPEFCAKMSELGAGCNTYDEE